MKIQKMMMFVAAATMLFAAACSKDDDKKSEPTEAAANTLVIDGTTYKLDSRFHGTDRGYADATTIETNGAGEPKYTIVADVEVETFNHTYDFPLGQQGGMLFFSIHDYNYGYERSVGDFVSGTLNIVKDESVFVYKVMGKTSQGENISFQIRVLASDWGNDER